ncbi:hypothetical protein [uncultured Aquimarina sp.]|uniref:hypothetical protein n=1 Tax=uncultured Aquimarina sp. TaxID=575652 RepID=UPI0026086F14|nr:hypothetical protein [uncultured Aquimarina sp.]
MKLLQLIEMRLKDLVTRVGASLNFKLNLKILGSVLVILSGLILFTDKVTNISLDNTYGFKSTKTFIWVLSQSLGPLIMAFATLLKPYRSSYAVPVYIYFIQVYWVFKPSIKFDDFLLQTYAIGTCLLFIFLLYLFNRLKSYHVLRENENKEFIRETKETIEILKRKILKDA